MFLLEDSSGVIVLEDDYALLLESDAMATPNGWWTVTYDPQEAPMGTVYPPITAPLAEMGEQGLTIFILTKQPLPASQWLEITTPGGVTKVIPPGLFYIDGAAVKDIYLANGYQCIVYISQQDDFSEAGEHKLQLAGVPRTATIRV